MSSRSRVAGDRRPRQGEACHSWRQTATVRRLGQRRSNLAAAGAEERAEGAADDVAAQILEHALAPTRGLLVGPPCRGCLLLLPLALGRSLALGSLGGARRLAIGPGRTRLGPATRAPIGRGRRPSGPRAARASPGDSKPLPEDLVG